MRFIYHLVKSVRIRVTCAAVFVVAIALIVPQAARAQFLHPKITSKQTTIRNVVLLPAKVEIVKQGMKGPEGMAAESDLLSARVTQLVTEALATKHITASTGPASRAGEGEGQQKYTVADIQSRYDALLPKIRKQRKDMKKGRFSLGDEVLNLNLDKNADAIVFIRGQGQKLTKGKTAFTILVGGLPAYFQLTIGIVDAHTGEVLLYTDALMRGDATSENEKPLRKAIEKSFKKLPAVAP